MPAVQSMVSCLAEALSWPAPSPSELSIAESRLRAVLADRTQAVCGLAAFYKETGNFAGGTFTDLAPVEPDNLTASDLLAVTLMNIEATPRAVRAASGLSDGPATVKCPAQGSRGRSARPCLRRRSASCGGTVRGGQACARQEPMGHRQQGVRTQTTAAVPRPRQRARRTARPDQPDYRTDLLAYRHLVTRPDLMGTLQERAAKANTSPVSPT
jgi:hypothetical protein